MTPNDCVNLSLWLYLGRNKHDLKIYLCDDSGGSMGDSLGQLPPPKRLWSLVKIAPL